MHVNSLQRSLRYSWLDTDTLGERCYKHLWGGEKAVLNASHHNLELQKATGTRQVKQKKPLHISGCESTLQNFFKSLHTPEGINLIPQLYCRWLKWSKYKLNKAAKIAITCLQRVKGGCVVRPPLGNPSIPPKTERECNDLKEAKQKENSENTQYFYRGSFDQGKDKKFRICQTSSSKVSGSPQSTGKRPELSAYPAVEMGKIQRQKRRNYCGLPPCTSGVTTAAKVTHWQDLQTRNTCDAGQEDQTQLPWKNNWNRNEVEWVICNSWQNLFEEDFRL